MLARLWLIWLSVVYCFHSRRSLTRKLESELFTQSDLCFSPSFSGRDAIHQLAMLAASQALLTGSTPVAVIPDYICNVVEKAMRKAGYEIVCIETDQSFEVSISKLVETINKFRPTVVLVASLYGTGGCLQLLRDKQLLEAIHLNKTTFILDLCQDISLVRHVPASASSQIWCVVSFNDKSFPGAMGGGIVGRERICFPETISWLQHIQLLLYLLKKTLKSTIRRARHWYRPSRYTKLAGFEYSVCDRFPFDIAARNATRLQLTVGLIGLKRLPFLLSKRQRNTDMVCPDSKFTFSSTSPFIIVDRQAATFPHRLKRPYATFDSKSSSIRPRIVVMHNKGFDDY